MGYTVIEILSVAAEMYAGVRRAAPAADAACGILIASAAPVRVPVAAALLGPGTDEPPPEQADKINIARSAQVRFMWT